MRLENGLGHNSLNTLSICSKSPSLRRGRAIFTVWGFKFCKREGGLLISNARLQECTMAGICLVEEINIEVVSKIGIYFENHRRLVSKRGEREKEEDNMRT